VKPSERFGADVTNLIEFRDAFIDMINATQVVSPRFIQQRVPNVDPTTWNGVRHRVAVAAGPARLAYNRHGDQLSLRQFGTVTNGISPVANWEMALSAPESLPPESVVSMVETAAGLAFSRQKQAAGNEKGVVGLVAAFMRWPSNLREAVGPGSTQRRAATVVGIAGQVLTGVIVAGIVAGIVWAWKLVA